MFYDAIEFNIDLSTWETSKVTTMKVSKLRTRTALLHDVVQHCIHVSNWKY